MAAMKATETQSQLARAGAAAALALLAIVAAAPLAAQEPPYFVLYDHHMEEPGTLEISLGPVLSTPKQGVRSFASNLEFEYGAKAWWTTSLYLDGPASAGESVPFTGYRIENRFRLLFDERVVNPVLYVEYANTNGADRLAREVVGFDSWQDFADPIGDARHDHDRELETKLILSSNTRGWNFAGNAIAEKNLAGPPWEFGYAIGASRPLALVASPSNCSFCRENFSAGVELYGGVGDQRNMTFSGTSHYVAPTVAWTLPGGVTLRFSPAWGLTSSSNRSFMRFGISYEGRVR